jgi:hypothetical protein
VKAVARPGTSITVQYRRFSELGAKISWFRAGYLALFAAAGIPVCTGPRDRNCASPDSRI